MAIATAVGVAATVASTAISSAAKHKQAKTAQGAAQQNIALMQQQKQVTGEATAIQLLQQQRTAYKAQGETTAGYAASGVRVAGSALDALAEGTRNEALDAKLIQKQGELNQLQIDTGINQEQANASAAKSAASGAIIGGALGAASDLTNAGVFDKSSSSNSLNKAIAALPSGR